MRLSFEEKKEPPRRPGPRVHKCLNCSMELDTGSGAQPNLYTRRFCSEDCHQAYLTPP